MCTGSVQFDKKHEFIAVIREDTRLPCFRSACVSLLPLPVHSLKGLSKVQTVKLESSQHANIVSGESLWLLNKDP